MFDGDVLVVYRRCRFTEGLFNFGGPRTVPSFGDRGVEKGWDHGVPFVFFPPPPTSSDKEVSIGGPVYHNT